MKMTSKSYFNWKSWAMGVALFFFVMGSTTYFYIDYELSRMYGGHTEVAYVSIGEGKPDIFAIKNVSVLAPSSDNFLDAQTVFIRNGIIESFDTDMEIASGTAVIDGSGKFLVPGYTDSHVHLWESENDLLLYVANGVTQIREMNGSEAHLRWKNRIKAGQIGPDIFVVAPQIATYGFFEGLFVGWTQNKTIVRSDRQIERAVQSFKRKGYDAVKASSFLDRDDYIALSKLTEDMSIPLVGHLPLAVKLADLWRSNQTEIAHVEELMKALNREFGSYDYENVDEFLEFVRSRSDEVADRLIEKDISVTSTLSLIDSFHKQKSDLAKVLGSTELKYANPGITEGTVITSQAIGWLPEVNIYRWPDDWDEERREKSRTYWQTYSQAQHIIFEALLEKGVPIMAGTDANVPVMVPGFSLHEEMMLLSEAGMSNAQVLASATSVPARWMGANMGEVSAGFKANLVLLKDNPLQDIGATDSIEMVIVNGLPLTRSDLDAMLLAVQEANDASRNVPVSIQ